MATYQQPGEVMTFTAPSGGVTAGTPVLIGSLLVRPAVTAAEGVVFAAEVEGVWAAVVKATGSAWTEGQKLYWDAGNSRFTHDSTAGMLVGVAAEAAASGATTGKVRLNGVAPATAEGAQGAIVALTDNTGVSGSHDDTLADGLTATAPAAVTPYTAHASGSTPVTSNAATDLDTTAAALATLEDEVTALTAVVAACVTDLTVQNQNDSDLAQKILEMRTALIAAGILTA